MNGLYCCPVSSGGQIVPAARTMLQFTSLWSGSTHTEWYKAQRQITGIAYIWWSLTLWLCYPAHRKTVRSALTWHRRMLYILLYHCLNILHHNGREWMKIAELVHSMLSRNEVISLHLFLPLCGLRLKSRLPKFWNKTRCLNSVAMNSKSPIYAAMAIMTAIAEYKYEIKRKLYWTIKASISCP